MKINAGESWAVWTIGGAHLIGFVRASEAEVEALDDREWITIERPSSLSIQVAMTQRGPAVMPVSIPYVASADELSTVRVRVRAIEAIWWRSSMSSRAARDFDKRAEEAAQASASLAAAGAGILVR